MIKTTASRYPSIGPDRELKRLIEAYWKGSLSKEEFESQYTELNQSRLQTIIDSGADIVPTNDFTPYDFMLDTSAMLGVIPNRYDWQGGKVDIDTYFAMARGTQKAVACELTKWFDTNYHYIVPEFEGEPFKLTENTPLKNWKWAKEKTGLNTKPVIVGPFTYVYLGKVKQGSGFIKSTDSEQFDALVKEAAKVYNSLLRECQSAGVTTVQIDEPGLVLDLSPSQEKTLIEAYQTLTSGITLDIHVHTYYESISNYDRMVKELPVQGIGLDFVSNTQNIDSIQKKGFPKDKTLIAGVIDGRSVWKTDLQETYQLIQSLLTVIGEDKILLSNAAPLSHLPVSTAPEKGHLTDDVLALISFANEKLSELHQLKKAVTPHSENKKQTPHDRFSNRDVQLQLSNLNEISIGRKTPFENRYDVQMEALKLPDFPTTTIGSFPQTDTLRKKRAACKAGTLSIVEYEKYIETYIDDVVRLQETLDIDVLVHGEPERTDMVEFFGQQLEGFAFTKKGWVQSYGSRCVRPPIIYGDVSRKGPMTVKETAYAQSITKRPMKGMLTGPVTILNWSFYRRDIPKKQIAYQIGLAIRDEVKDLESAGIKIIQIDEPAFREGLPLKKASQRNYLNWAVIAFKLSHDTVEDTTQIHTHMCYSEFNEIIDSIRKMDADVISIEASRSKGEIIEVFEKFNYPLGIGLGVYDIHSPRIPSIAELTEIAERSVRVINKNLVWINPDCGLKTRGFKETTPALENMVAVAKSMRKEHATNKASV